MATAHNFFNKKGLEPRVCVAAAETRAGLELGRIEDKCQWDWGELADEVKDQSLREYADRVGREFTTLKRYRTVVRNFP